MFSLLCEAIFDICVIITIANICSRWVLLNFVTPVEKFAGFATQHWKIHFSRCFKVVHAMLANVAHFWTDPSCCIVSTHLWLGAQLLAVQKFAGFATQHWKIHFFRCFKVVHAMLANAAHFWTDPSCYIVSTYLGMGAQLVAAHKFAWMPPKNPPESQARPRWGEPERSRNVANFLPLRGQSSGCNLWSRPRTDRWQEWRINRYSWKSTALFKCLWRNIYS